MLFDQISFLTPEEQLPRGGWPTLGGGRRWFPVVLYKWDFVTEVLWCKGVNTVCERLRKKQMLKTKQFWPSKRDFFKGKQEFALWLPVGFLSNRRLRSQLPPYNCLMIELYIYIYKPIPPTHLRVFFSQGRLNHSCAPNLEFQLDWDEQQQTVVTLGPCLKEVRRFPCHQVLHESAVYIDMIYVYKYIYIYLDMI